MAFVTCQIPVDTGFLVGINACHDGSMCRPIFHATWATDRPWLSRCHAVPVAVRSEAPTDEHVHDDADYQSSDNNVIACLTK